MTMQRYSAATLEQALSKVKRAHGEGASIVSAERVRSGGMGGFFAQEHVEVLVEVGEKSTLDDKAPTSTSNKRGGPTATSKPAKPTPAKATSDDELIVAALADPSAVPMSLEDLADTVSTVERVIATLPDEPALAPSPTSATADDQHTQLRTDDAKLLADDAFDLDSFEAVLERIAASGTAMFGGAEARDVVDRQRARTLDDSASLSDTTPTAKATTATTPAPSTVAASAPSAQTPAPTPRTEPERVARTPEAPATATPRPADVNLKAQVRSTRPVIDATSVPAATITPTQTTPPAVATPVIPPQRSMVRSSPATSPIPQQPTSVLETSNGAAGHIALARMGVPQSVLQRLDPRIDLYPQLIESFRSLPRASPIPTERGAVVAVIGWRRAAISTARDLAAQLGIDDDNVWFACSRNPDPDFDEIHVLSNNIDAAAQRRGWRRNDQPTIVAIDAALGGRDIRWAEQMLQALSPTEVWGTVDATRKVEDVQDWIEGVGGVDALTLVGASLTRTPAAILQLGVPVAMLDGELATPERWAGLLTARLAA